MCFCTAKPACVGPNPSVWGASPVAPEVEPGAEAPPLPGEHDDPARGVDRDVVEGGVEAADELRGHRVQLVGTVQSDEPDTLTRGRDEHGIHAREGSPGIR